MEYTFSFEDITYYIEPDHKHIRRVSDDKRPHSQRYVAMSYLRQENIFVDDVTETTHTAVRKVLKHLRSLNPKGTRRIVKTDDHQSSSSKIDKLIDEIVISKETLNRAELSVRNDWWYGTNQAILESILEENPNNKDDSSHGISKKVKYLDTFYSTNLKFLGQNYIELTVSKILSIKNFDRRVRTGDNTLVHELMALSPSNYRFSFATKYCALHNPDFYYIYDSINKKVLPKLLRSLAQKARRQNNFQRNELLLKHSRNIIKWISQKDYTNYNNVISDVLENLENEVKSAKRKLDWLLWYQFKNIV